MECTTKLLELTDNLVELVKKNGGKAILTSNNHLTGTDRVYEVFEKEFKAKFKERSITYEHSLIDDMVACGLKWN